MAIRLIFVVALIITIWACCNILLGSARDFREGFQQVLDEFKKFFGAGAPPQPAPQEYGPDYFVDLTDSLTPHFSYLRFERGISDGVDIKVLYRFKGADVGFDVVEYIFEFFIRDFLNLHSSVPVDVFAQKHGEHMCLVYARSDNLSKWVRAQRANRLSRMEPPSDELIE